MRSGEIKLQEEDVDVGSEDGLDDESPWSDDSQIIHNDARAQQDKRARKPARRASQRDKARDKAGSCKARKILQRPSIQKPTLGRRNPLQHGRTHHHHVQAIDSFSNSGAPSRLG